MLYRPCVAVIRSALTLPPICRKRRIYVTGIRAVSDLGSAFQHGGEISSSDREEQPKQTWIRLVERLRRCKVVAPTPRISYSVPLDTRQHQARPIIPVAPQKWSSTSLSLYIRDLTHVVSKYQHQANQRILSVFDNEALRPYLTLQAFKEALSYSYKHSEFRTARKILSRLQDTVLLGRGMASDAEVVELILWGTGAHRDLKTFLYLINRHMNNDGPITAGIWLALLRIAPSEADRYAVWNIMMQRGMLQDLGILRKSVVLCVDQDFQSHLEQRKSFRNFINAYDHKFVTTKWLSPTVGNIMLRVITLSRDHGPAQALELLTYLQDCRSWQPDQDTLNTMIYWRPTYVDAEVSSQMTLKVLRHFHQLSIYPGLEAYNTLFNRFYRRRAYNCIKVLWIAACADSAANHAIVDKMTASLLQKAVRESDDGKYAYANKFTYAVGKIAVGINVSGPAKWRHVRRDLSRSKTHRLRQPLHELLESAMALDKRWIADKVWETKDVAWMRENSIFVDTCSLHTTHQISGT